MRTKTIELYTFKELDKEIQDKIIEKNRDINDYDNWCEYTIDMLKEAGMLIGIDIDNIYFSGFWSQGDGACFEGNYEYRKGGFKDIQQNFPNWKELHNIAQNLQSIQKDNFYQLMANVSQKGMYYHERSTIINVCRNDGVNVKDSVKDELKEILRDFMILCYDALEKEYEYLSSKEAIKDMIISMDYEYTKDGEQV